MVSALVEMHDPVASWKHPFVSWMPFPKVEDAVVLVMLRMSAWRPPSNVEVDVLPTLNTPATVVDAFCVSTVNTDVDD